MTDPAEPAGVAPEPGEQTVRLMALGHPGAPVCDGDVCYLPPVVPAARGEDPDRPQ